MSFFVPHGEFTSTFWGVLIVGMTQLLCEWSDFFFFCHVKQNPYGKVNSSNFN